MKAAVYSAVLVPALVLCAALTAASDGAGAGEEPLVLFPDAAADGGGRTTQATPLPLGATAASPVAPAAPTSAREETANATEVPAVPETAAEPAVIGTTAVRGTPQDRTRETQADTPVGGSRLLRALAEMPETGDMPARDVSPAYAAEDCPRGLLQRLLAGAAGEADALSALGIEREILTLCRERQEILVGLFEAEAALQELRATRPGPAVEAVVKPAAEAAPSASLSQAVPAIRAVAPSPLRAALSSTAENADQAEPQAPRYAWFSIIGTAGALRAGITDGSGVWFVREGDALPGGARIAAIAGRPPAVLVTGSGETLVAESGEATPLPYRARPGDAP